MTEKFYPADATAFSQSLKGALCGIDGETQGLRLLGGWAVFELVDPTYAMESQDIDVLVHNEAAWNRMLKLLESEGGRPARSSPAQARRATTHRGRQSGMASFATAPGRAAV